MWRVLLYFRPGGNPILACNCSRRQASGRSAVVLVGQAVGAGKLEQRELRAGDVVLLAGRLGAGKTLLAAGIGEGLGVEEPLTSPSFILARAHEGFLPVVHADVYRLGTSAEFEDLDLPEQARDGVLLIEWGDREVRLERRRLETGDGDDEILFDNVNVSCVDTFAGHAAPDLVTAADGVECGNR